MCMLIKCNSLQLVEYFTYCCFLVLFFSILQTWKTSRLREEALCQYVKVKEWFCSAALHLILEVKIISSLAFSFSFS